MRRIPWLALVSLLLLAGCSQPGSITATQVDDRGIAERASRSLESLDGEHPIVREIHSTVKRAILNGSAVFEATSSPFETGLIFEYNGSYYNVTWEVADRVPGRRVSVEIDYDPSGSVTGERVRYSDLPKWDRELLGNLLPPEGKPPTGEGYDVGVGGVLTENEINRSSLAREDYGVVVYDGREYPVRTDTDEVTVNVYRYTAEMVFENATEYARSLRRRYMFRLANLSEDERSVLREAIDGGYYAENTDDRAFGSLIKRLRRHESITGNDDTSGEWLVRYGGDTYWVEASYGRFTRDRGS